MVTQKNRILVVDDEPEIVGTLKSFLSRKGYEVNGAASGKEALELLEEKRADVILLDMMMPGIQGADIARIVKEKYPETKIIIVTAYSNEGNKLYQENQLEGLLIKPVNVMELYNKLLQVFSAKEYEPEDLKPKVGTEARVLLLKAKLFFLENSEDNLKALKSHFEKLSTKGEDFELNYANNENQLIEKLSLFGADILLVNSAFLKIHDMDIFSKIVEFTPQLKETIIYNVEGADAIAYSEIEKLTKSVETACLRNGLIEIKWVRI